MPVKVLFFGTHPKQFNGYSKVVYELSKWLCKSKDIELTIWGFQNFYNNDKHRRDLPDNVRIVDAFANEDPKGSGFGIEQIEKYVKENPHDVCIVYNDLLVITQVLNKLRSSQVPMKIISYVDQVYLCQKKEFIEQVNKLSDFAVAFTPYWENVMKDQGISLPSSYLQHGFNKDSYFPIPKNIARKYFNIKEDDFIILNLNRNQPRKRWDICLKAFAEVVSRHQDDPIKMIIATSVQGAWNLLDIFERELKKRNVHISVGLKHLIMLDNPQKITDEETNILYNVADIGINTCDGEGFGLCNFEQAGLGIPQVVPRIGGYLDFFDDESAWLVDPILAYYVDNTRDMVCGEALMCDYMDYAEGIIAYYKDEQLRKKHGQRCREKITKEYGWEMLAKKLEGIILEVHPIPKTEEAVPPVPVQELKEMVENIDINEVSKFLKKDPIVPVDDSSDAPEKVVGKKKIVKKKGKTSAKAQKTIKELQLLKKKIDSLLEGTEESDDE